jgi:hypothetical protein
VLAPETGFVASVSDIDAESIHAGDISIGISGPHDFAVRPEIARQAIPFVHRIPRPTFRDGREAPLYQSVKRGGLIKLICPTAQGKFSDIMARGVAPAG